MKNKKNLLPLLIGCALLLVFILAAFFPNILVSNDPKKTYDKWLEPSSTHILGTNDMGYDIFTELVYATKSTITIGILSSIFTVILGIIIGLLSTIKKAHIGDFFSTLIQIFIMTPKMILILVLISFIGPTKFNIILMITIFSWASTAKIVRAKVLHLSEEPFIINCEKLGYNKIHTTIYHYIPNLSDVILSRFLRAVHSAIMMESTLSFLGFGDLYNPSWGTMINFAYKRGAFLMGAYNYLLSPAFCIILVSISFYLISIYFENKNKMIQSTSRG